MPPFHPFPHVHSQVLEELSALPLLEEVGAPCPLQCTAPPLLATWRGPGGQALVQSVVTFCTLSIAIATDADPSLLQQMQASRL